VFKTKNNGGVKVSGIKTIETKTIEAMGIRCPVCGSNDYLSYKELYDEEWISLQCECLNCHTLFQINYRAVGIDIIAGDKKL
jgi:hypothetical protein